MHEESEVLRLAEFFGGGPAVFLTGAGISTDSGIPDYRGEGSPPRTPMNIEQFLHEKVFRARYWAGSSVAAERFGRVKPNAGHFAVAELEREGFAAGVLTQNVDGLHLKAGSDRVVELHGSGDRVICTGCRALYTRAEIVTRFALLNPGYIESQQGARVNPDGDTEVTGFEDLDVPLCEKCGSTLRPDIVYFGETVPVQVFAAAEKLVDEASLLVVAGSSLAVNTGVRLVHRAKRQGMPIVVINRGSTALDNKADLRIEGGVSETLTALKSVLAV